MWYALRRPFMAEGPSGGSGSRGRGRAAHWRRPEALAPSPIPLPAGVPDDCEHPATIEPAPPTTAAASPLALFEASCGPLRRFSPSLRQKRAPGLVIPSVLASSHTLHSPHPAHRQHRHLGKPTSTPHTERSRTAGYTDPGARPAPRVDRVLTPGRLRPLESLFFCPERSTH